MSMMNLLSIVICAIAVLGVSAWTEDPSCDGHDGDTVDRRARALQQDVAVPLATNKRKNLGSSYNVTKNLRGISQRNLGANPTIETTQLKLHWEEGYCWQLEAIERKWCMSCHGGTCGENETLWIQECNDSLIQRFVWEPVTVPGRTNTGKLKPYLAQNLCLDHVGSDGTYSHFGVTNPRWWYFLLRPCDDANLDTQILEGYDRNEPFEFLSRDDTQEKPVRCLSQAHDPRAGEIILGEALHVARFDFTSLWDAYNLHSDLPETPSGNSNSLFCPPWPLMKTDDEEWEIVTSGNTIVNWDADTFVEQFDNGRFVVQRGFPDRKETILFDNELDLSKDDYFTKLRGNGDLMTFRGTPDNPKGSSVWKIDNDYPEGQYFLGVECDLGTVSLYEFVPEDPGDQLWSTNGTDWVPDGSTMPPIGSESPSSAPSIGSESPSSAPSTSSPTVSAVPSSEVISTPMPSVSPTAAPSVVPSAGPSAAPISVAPSTGAPTVTAGTGPIPEVVAMGGDFCTPTNPCPLCYGDCDNDDDCEGDLVCEQRDPNEPVSGCSGGEDSSSNTDYCVLPEVSGSTTSPPAGSPAAASPTNSAATGAPTSSPSASPTASVAATSIPTSIASSSPSVAPSATPTEVIGTVGSGPAPGIVAMGSDYCTPTNPCGLCYGDCDVDDDCEGDLVCEERDANEAVSSCSGGEDSGSSTDYCVLPDSSFGRTSTSLSYSDSCSPSSPCDKCVGDCDQDADCAGDLVCPDRNGGEAVPGCVGTDDSKTDFCVEP